MDVHDLVPGSVPKEQFDLLLKGTDIRGKNLLAALEMYLVSGVPPKDACEQMGVNRGQFSLRLKAVHRENERVVSLLKFYAIP